MPQQRNRSSTMYRRRGKYAFRFTTAPNTYRKIRKAFPWRTPVDDDSGAFDSRN
jgi:hypothetical protein